MDNQKIVMILLIITIVLSVGSIIFTLVANPNLDEPKEVISIDKDRGAGQANFEIVVPSEGTG